MLTKYLTRSFGTGIGFLRRPLAESDPDIHKNIIN